jgi:hypothetical protein
MVSPDDLDDTPSDPCKHGRPDVEAMETVFLRLVKGRKTVREREREREREIQWNAMLLTILMQFNQR